jgi:hypothetical protein
MIVIVDAVLGLLLAVSALLFAICLISYKRSGVKPIVLSCYVLVASAAYDLAVLAVGHWTDWLVNVDETLIVVIGAVILVLGVIVSRVRGRSGEGPA